MGTAAVSGCTPCTPIGADWEQSGRPAKISTSSKVSSGWVLPQRIFEEDLSRKSSNRPILDSVVQPCPSAHVLKCTIDDGFELSASSVQARELLHAAATGCDIAAQRLILQEKVDSNIWRRSCDKNGDTALLLAARGGHRLIAQLLVGHAADLNWRNQEGETALHAACDHGHAEIVELLCTSGADPCMGDITKNEPPGLVAVRKHAELYQQNPTLLSSMPHHLERHRSCIEVCLTTMAQRDGRAPAGRSLVNSDGLTGLHIAAEKSDNEICTVLLQYKAFVEAREAIEGKSSLMQALRAGASMDTVKLLLRSLADPRGRDRHKGTPLHYAVALGDAGLPHVALLLRAKADVDSLDERGAGALALAALRGAPAVVRELLTGGACPRVCVDIFPHLSAYDEGQDACRRILEAVT